MSDIEFLQFLFVVLSGQFLIGYLIVAMYNFLRKAII